MDIRWKRLMVASVIISTLTACSSNSGTSNEGTQAPSTPAPETQTAPPKPARTGPVDINLVCSDTVGMSEDYLAELQKKFPDYKITHIRQTVKGQSVAELIASGVKIDIVCRAGAGYLGDVLDMNLQTDMTGLLKDYKINTADFDAQTIQYIKDFSDGNMYGIPGGSAIIHSLFYNKTLFNQFGVPYPKDGMTWTEMMDLAARMTRMDNGKQIYGFTTSTNIVLGVNQLGANYVDRKTNKPTLSSDPRWRSYMDILFNNAALNNAYRANNKAFSGGTARLVEGDTAMLVFNVGISLATKELAQNLIDWDMVAMPSFAEAPRTGSPIQANIYGITSQTRDKEAAMEIIAEIVSENRMIELARKGNFVPMVTENVKSQFAAEAKPEGKNWKSVYYNKFPAPMYPLNVNGGITSAFAKQVEAVVAGTIDINTALRLVDEEATKLIEAEAKK